MTVTIHEIYRYPVKGLSGERLDHVTLSPGDAIPHDRRFALAHGSVQFDRKNPTWMAKTNFLMLMKNEKLAQLRVRFEPETGFLTIERDGKQVIKANATEPLGRTLIGQFFASFMAAETRGTPKLVDAPGHMFSDVPEKVLSIISLASIRDLERVVRQPVHPLRFRANVYLDGARAWQEFDWSDKEISLGDVRLKVIGPIDRCAATNVDPETAQRDLNIPLDLKRGFGHVNMGVYAEVLDAGTVSQGDSVTYPD